MPRTDAPFAGTSIDVDGAVLSTFTVIAALRPVLPRRVAGDALQRVLAVRHGRSCSTSRATVGVSVAVATTALFNAPPVARNLDTRDADVVGRRRARAPTRCRGPGRVVGRREHRRGRRVGSAAAAAETRSPSPATAWPQGPLSSRWRGTASTGCSGLASSRPRAAHGRPSRAFAELRVSIVRPLPDGSVATRSSVVQSTVVPASNVCDW